MDKKLILEIKQIIQSEKLDIDLNLSNELLIREFQKKTNWVYISSNLKLSEKFIEKFKNKVDWSNISRCQKLSEKFIEKFKNKIAWIAISIYQKLSEKFIEKFHEKVYWNSISANQKLSEKFILKNWNKLNHYSIIRYQKSLTPAFLLWLYKTYQEEEYNLLKIKPGFKQYSKKIEEEVKIIMIEIT